MPESHVHVGNTWAKLSKMSCAKSLPTVCCCLSPGLTVPKQTSKTPHSTSLQWPGSTVTGFLISLGMFKLNWFCFEEMTKPQLPWWLCCDRSIFQLRSSISLKLFQLDLKDLSFHCQVSGQLTKEDKIVVKNSVFSHHFVPATYNNAHCLPATVSVEWLGYFLPK